MHSFIWDLDRTYLETDIHSMRGLLKTALETAHQKQNIPGAVALLQSLLAHNAQARATIISGSPRQMREVLEEKLHLDGIAFDQLILKDNLRNLTRGRFKAIRSQVGYKLPALLSHRLTEPEGATVSLFGDDSEVDALVYALFAEILAGRVPFPVLRRVMRASGAYDDEIHATKAMIDKLSMGPAVHDIFIHVDIGAPLALYKHLAPRIDVVYSWFQAALALYGRGRLQAADVTLVAAAVAQSHAWGWQAISGWIQDATRRGMVARDAAASWLEQAPSPLDRTDRNRVIDHLRAPEALSVDRSPDWLGFLDARAKFSVPSDKK